MGPRNRREPVHRRSPQPGFMAFILVLGLSLSGSAIAVEIGDVAPDFRLMDLDGNTVRLTDEAGKVVLLYFLGYDVELCRETAATIEGLHLEYEAQGLRAYGIDCWDGTPDQLGAWWEATGATYPVLLGGSGAATAYDLPYHSIVVIDTEGEVAYVSPGPAPDAFDRQEVEDAVVHSLNHANSTREATWGAIKTLYGSRFLRASLMR